MDIYETMKHTIQKSLLTLLGLLLCANIMAVPAEHIRCSVRLVDGTEVMATLYGNHNYSWMLTDDGVVLEESEEQPGLFVRTSLTLEEAGQRMVALSESHHRHAPRRIGAQSTAPLPSVGSPKIPVLLVSFADEDFTVADTDEKVREFYDLYCNGTRDGQLYTAHKSRGSIRDYFIEQSDSLFQPEFVIIGPVKLANNYAHYGQNSGGKDKNYSQFTSEAVRKAVEQFDIDWLGMFDNRGKGQVDIVFYLFAGLGEANSGDPDRIWAKEETSSTTVNGIKFASSACTGELRPSGNTRAVDGIGIMCHELSHALGLPDFYDTSYKAFGMDLWSLMDYGCYGSNGYCPCSYTAYERDFMGWQPLEELTVSQKNITLLPTAAGGKGLKIVNPGNPKEYYILENRQRVAADLGICQYGHGLQVTHVDFDQTKWNNNNVNTEAKHQRMTIFAANNRYIGTSRSDATWDDILLSWEGNLYPFTIFDDAGDLVGVNDSLTTNSTPAATLFNTNTDGTKFMNKPILNIRENKDTDKTISFDFYASLDDMATELSAVAATPQSAANGQIFDLAGRRVNGSGFKFQGSQLPKGVYIQNGKKVMIKD